jgi:hypothetical protein
MLAYIFVAVALAVRFMPHPWTFTPVVASLLFFGARGSRRGIWIPWTLLAASDVVLTKLVYHYPYFTWDHYVTWAWYAAILCLGTTLRGSTKPMRVIGAALASSVSFYLISNFDVWVATNLYPKTLAGLMTSYTLALPFFRNAVEGDLLFTALMFATPAMLHKLEESLGQSDHAAAA